MTKLKKILAGVIAAAMASTLCLSVSAASNSETFTGTTGYKIEFQLDVSTRVIAGAVYQLTAHAEELGSKPYYYPKLNIKAVLYGTGSTNSVSDRTFENSFEGEVDVTRGSEECAGKGYGYFHAYGNAAYGDVSGTVYIP